MKLTFVKIKHPDGSYGVTIQESVTEQEAVRLTHKLNQIWEIIQ